MLKRLAQIALIASGMVVLLMVLTMGWLKSHEDEVVFAAARGRQHLLTVLPADAQRVTVPEPNGVALAALMYRADADAAYQDLLRRGIPANRIILLGHSLGSGPAVWLATRHAAAALVLFGAFTSIPDAAAYRYPYLPVRMAVGVQFNSLARIGDVHMPVVIAHSRGDKLIPYAHALTLIAAANEPKHLITFDPASNDGFGGHVDALYDHVDILKATLAALIPALGERSVAQTPQ